MLFVLVTCPPLDAPSNGQVMCSLGDDGVLNPGDICRFTCEDGFQRQGSARRVCRDDGSWSRTDVLCISGMNKLKLFWHLQEVKFSFKVYIIVKDN